MVSMEIVSEIPFAISPPRIVNKAVDSSMSILAIPGRRSSHGLAVDGSDAVPDLHTAGAVSIRRYTLKVFVMFGTIFSIG